MKKQAKKRQDYIAEWSTNLKEEQKRLNENIIQTSSSINEGLAKMLLGENIAI